jgi:predicted dehydrogenase
VTGRIGLTGTAHQDVRLGVVGLGRIGLLHAESLAGAARGVGLAWVVDASSEAARAAGERLGAPWSGSVEAVLEDPAVDGVVIATPTQPPTSSS